MSKGKREYGRRRPVTAAAMFAAAWGLILLAGGRISPETEQFCAAASPWVMMGLGVAGASALMSPKEGS